MQLSNAQIIDAVPTVTGWLDQVPLLGIFLGCLYLGIVLFNKSLDKREDNWREFLRTENEQNREAYQKAVQSMKETNAHDAAVFERTLESMQKVFFDTLDRVTSQGK